MSYALHFGAEVICVELGSTDNVFADLTNKREPKGYQIGEVTVEVQLKPGTYKRCKIDPNIQRRVAECIAKREARQTACSFALREATSKKLMLSNEIARIDQDLKRMCDDADIAYESEAQEISRIEKELEDD
jgi:hypothetical protein